MICAYCGSDGETTFDHVIARSAGGSDHHSNGVPACLDCNMHKGTRPAVVAPCGRLTWTPGKCVNPSCAACPDKPVATLFTFAEAAGEEVELVETAAALMALTARRAELIGALHVRGASLRQIGALAGLTAPGIAKILQRQKDS